MKLLLPPFLLSINFPHETCRLTWFIYWITSFSFFNLESPCLNWNGWTHQKPSKVEINFHLDILSRFFHFRSLILGCTLSFWHFLLMWQIECNTLINSAWESYLAYFLISFSPFRAFTSTHILQNLKSFNGRKFFYSSFFFSCNSPIKRRWNHFKVKNIITYQCSKIS